MDKKIANNLIVGIFMLIGFAGFIFVLFTISGGKGIFSREYTLYGKWQNVKGLNFGSEVSLSGLRVGTVNKLSVATDGSKQLIVEFTVSREMFDKIRQDSVATIKTSGVLGDKYIELTIGDPAKPPIEPGTQIPCEEPADFFQKTGGVVEDISSQFKHGGNLDQLLANLNKVSANLATLTDDLRYKKGLWQEITTGKSGENFSRATESLAGILKKIDKGEGTLGSLVNDPTVYEDLKALMGGAKRSAILNYFMRSFIQSGEEEKNKSTK